MWLAGRLIVGAAPGRRARCLRRFRVRGLQAQRGYDPRVGRSTFSAHPAAWPRATPAGPPIIRRTPGATSSNASAAADWGCLAARRWPACWPSAGGRGTAAACPLSASTRSSPGPTPFMSAPAPGRTFTRGPSQRPPARPGIAVQTALPWMPRPRGRSSPPPRLLAERRGVYNPRGERMLSEEQILAWADVWRDATARAANRDRRDPGPAASRGEPWLRRPARGNVWSARRLYARSTVVELPIRKCTPRVPNLTEEQILAWADEHYRRMHAWPKVLSGPIFGAVHESWSKVDQAPWVGVRAAGRFVTLSVARASARSWEPRSSRAATARRRRSGGCS